jgi:hypothetical protein
LKVSWFDEEVAMIAPAGIALVNFFVTKSVFSEEGNHYLVFIIMGLVVALSYRIRAAAPVPDVLPARRSAPQRVLKAA